jgi:hypothetical protein
MHDSIGDNSPRRMPDCSYVLGRPCSPCPAMTPSWGFC